MPSSAMNEGSSVSASLPIFGTAAVCFISAILKGM
jgi:hypothetical protein